MTRCAWCRRRQQSALEPATRFTAQIGLIRARRTTRTDLEVFDVTLGATPCVFAGAKVTGAGEAQLRRFAHRRLADVRPL